MGLLDDAIREHLDLKRRRGADPAEVERAEQEALGPVRRAPERVPGDELEGEPGHDEHGLALDDEQGPALHDEQSPGLYDEQGDEPDHGYTPEAGPEPLEEHRYDGPEPAEPPLLDGLEPTEVHEYEDVGHFEEPGSHGEDESWSYEAEPGAPETAAAPSADPQEPPAQRPPSDPADFAGGETVEYDVEEALGESRRAHRDEDVKPVAPHHEPDPSTAPEDDDVLEETPEFLQDTPEHDRLWFEQRPPKDFDFDG